MIRWTWNQPTASGKRTGWAKTFTGFSPELKGAKAFVGGEYLTDGVEREDPKGTLFVEVSPVGSVKNGHYEARLWRVRSGKFDPVSEAFDWSKQWLSVKDAALKVLAEVSAEGSEPEPDPLVCPHCKRPF